MELYIFCALLALGVGDVVRELGRHSSRLDQRHPHATLGNLLAQRLAEGVDRPLAGVVNFSPGTGLASGDAGDVHDEARFGLGGFTFADAHDPRGGVR